MLKDSIGSKIKVSSYLVLVENFEETASNDDEFFCVRVDRVNPKQGDQMWICPNFSSTKKSRKILCEGHKERIK